MIRLTQLQNLGLQKGRITFKAYLCPNIINFDNVGFSEPRPEEVISFFWRSV